MELQKIYAENCLDTMARMPDGFVQCVITSPPYYGLRSYKTEPQIWDGDADCQHVWGEEIANPKLDTRPVELKVSQGATVGSNVASQHWAQGTMGSHCQLCQAWRGELGLEPRFQDFIRHLLQIFAEVKRVLKPDGTVWVNLGDSFAGSGKGIGDKNGTHGKSVFTDDHIQKTDWKQIDVRAKSLMNIPHRFFIAMTDELQMIQRNNINWWKRACMPSSAKDRFTVDFESIGFFTKNAKYKFNQQLERISDSTRNDIRTINENWSTARPERGFNGSASQATAMLKPTDPNNRNARTTWDIPFEPQSEEHYASYPTKLVERMMLAGTDEGDIVYDPFGGTATTALTAHRLGRQWICSELQPKYAEIANKRLEPYLMQEQLF